MADYETDFLTLAAKSAWNTESLFDSFLHGLSEDELAARELLVDLDTLIALTIKIDGRLRERKSERRSGLGHTCAPDMAHSPPMYSFRQLLRAESRPPDFSRESTTGEVNTPVPMQVGITRL